MSKKLIIVESPAKAKTITNFLDGSYVVLASKGHIRDLPSFNLGIKIENQRFTPVYEVTRDHKGIVKNIKEEAKNSDIVYIATDEDREGEAIGFHIAEVLGGKVEEYPRIVFHEITKKAILHALETPRHLDMLKVDAQQARRIVDRIVGFKLSQLLQNKIRKGLSAGRVQSSTLKLVIDREREIKDFVPLVYFQITGTFDGSVTGDLVFYKGNKIGKMEIVQQEFVNEILLTLSQEEFSVESIENKKRKVSTPPPFMTSTLQQAASSKFGFQPSKTMQIAQKLYEGVDTHLGTMGVITYMRTDSLNIAVEAQIAAREVIKSTYGEKYLPDEPKNYTSKAKGAQEAHEAIRPTTLSFTPEVAKKYLETDQLKVYELIYNRFLASQSVDAEFDNQVVMIKSNSGKFRAVGSKLSFDGFQKFTGSENKDKLLPELSVGQVFIVKEIKAVEKQTEPPSRFSEASLVKTMEDLGIGRPSTYASTIATLTKREYIKTENKQIHPTESAFTVIELLEKHFEQIVDSKYTANLEEKLDLVSEGKEDWQKELWMFYEPFEKQLEEGKNNIASQKVVVETGEKCPQCGSPLIEREGKFGKFISCSGYPKCKYIKPREKKGEEGVKVESRCPTCNAELYKRKGKFGDYYKCENGGCKFISKWEPVQESCPKCKGYMVKKVGLSEDKIICPKCDVKPKNFKKNWKKN